MGHHDTPEESMNYLASQGQVDAKRIAELEEAVRVLAARVASQEYMLACYRVARRPSELLLDNARETSDAVENNPTTRAAVEKARKGT